jgi:hypothetical protein
MATSWKVVQLFNWGSQGWAETWYYAASDDAFASVFQAAKGLGALRLVFLSASASMVGTRFTKLRVSDPLLRSQPNKSAVSDDNGCAGQGAALDKQGKVEPFPTGLGWLWTGYANDVDQRTVRFLRGLNQDQSSFKAPPLQFEVLPAAWAGSFAAYLQILGVAVGALGNQVPVPTNWRFKARDLNEAVRQTTPIQAIDILVGAIPRWQIVVDFNTAVQIGDRIHVHGVTGCATQGINGDAKVVGIATAAAPMTGQLITLNKCPPCVNSPPEYQGGAIAYKIAYQLSTINRYEFDRTEHKNTGRPFFATHGRRNRTRCCS